MYVQNIKKRGKYPNQLQNDTKKSFCWKSLANIICLRKRNVAFNGKTDTKLIISPHPSTLGFSSSHFEPKRNRKNNNIITLEEKDIVYISHFLLTSVFEGIFSNSFLFFLASSTSTIMTRRKNLLIFLILPCSFYCSATCSHTHMICIYHTRTCVRTTKVCRTFLTSLSSLHLYSTFSQEIIFLIQLFLNLLLQVEFLEKKSPRRSANDNFLFIALIIMLKKRQTRKKKIFFHSLLLMEGIDFWAHHIWRKKEVIDEFFVNHITMAKWSGKELFVAHVVMLWLCRTWATRRRQNW